MVIMVKTILTQEILFFGNHPCHGLLWLPFALFVVRFFGWHVMFGVFDRSSSTSVRCATSRMYERVGEGGVGANNMHLRTSRVIR